MLLSDTVSLGVRHADLAQGLHVQYASAGALYFTLTMAKASRVAAAACLGELECVAGDVRVCVPVAISVAAGPDPRRDGACDGANERRTRCRQWVRPISGVRKVSEIPFILHKAVSLGKKISSEQTSAHSNNKRISKEQTVTAQATGQPTAEFTAQPIAHCSVDCSVDCSAYCTVHVMFTAYSLVNNRQSRLNALKPSFCSEVSIYNETMCIFEPRAKITDKVEIYSFKFRVLC